MSTRTLPRPLDRDATADVVLVGERRTTQSGADPDRFVHADCFGSLPSISGGRRIARLLGGRRLDAGVFDPR